MPRQGKLFVKCDCDFCGKITITRTSPFGVFCKDCWEIIREEAEEAIFDIDDFEGINTK
jgi:hypothetical protein